MKFWLTLIYFKVHKVGAKIHFIPPFYKKCLKNHRQATQTFFRLNSSVVHWLTFWFPNFFKKSLYLAIISSQKVLGLTTSIVLSRVKLRGVRANLCMTELKSWEAIFLKDFVSKKFSKNCVRSRKTNCKISLETWILEDKTKIFNCFVASQIKWKF